MGQGSGFGKSILFGEHFVVYGLPAIAAGISSRTIAVVTRKDSPGWTLDDDRPAMPGYKEKKLDEQKVSIDNVIRYCGIDLSKEGIHIELKGDLVCASGIGASAANCVALARALNDEFDLELSDERINEAGYEGEKGYHGTPSGIDNTASTFGGLVWYIRNLDGDSPTFEKIKLEKPAYLVIASTGLTASTKEVVGDVRAKKEEDPEWFEEIIREYDELVHDAKKALMKYNMEKVGQLMNRNHELLQKITVSCKELDELVKVAKEHGALGAKMTGTGRGGNMIALAQDETTQVKIKEALIENGAAGAWTTTFGI
ncbi:MAG: mevalonate kinase [Candidatus Lokiarchaeota archaeon]|nr:mevalonate kinase [Candidatus Lokiarchaeota archaeon]